MHRDWLLKKIYLNYSKTKVACLTHLLEAWTGIANLIEHRPLGGSLTNIRIVLLTRLSTAWCTPWPFISRLVKI